MDLIASGDLDPGACRVVWNVNDRAVIHPVGQVQIPSTDYLRPVRRIGTFKGAESRISMFPVARGGKVTMLELDSNLELHHGTELSMDRRVSEIFAQPFLMLWRHSEGSVVHIPDLAAIVDGRLKVYDVKPDERADDSRARRVFEFVDETLRCGHVEFKVLGSVSKQRQINVERLARYRHEVPDLDTLLDAVRPQRPRTIGGFYYLVCQHLGLSRSFAMPQPGSRALIGLDAALYALAHGAVTADLDLPLQLPTALTWTAEETSR